MRLRVAAVVLPAALWAGCAQLGPLTPPSAHLPRPPADFTAVRQGPQIELRWTPPSSSSDGVAWQGALSYRLCAWPGIERGSPAPPPPAALPTPPQIPSPPPKHAGAAETPAGISLPPCPHWIAVSAGPPAALPLAELGATDAFATLAIYALNAQGEGAGWSNQAVVALTPVLPAPHLDTATPTAEGVVLTWQPQLPAAGQVHLYRDGSLLASIAAKAGSYLDATAAWDQHYRYWLRSAAGGGSAAVESMDSNVLQVTPVDVFPPPAPTGLEAIAMPGATAAVELSWNAVTSPDRAGYNLYRQQGDGPWQELNPAPLPTPVFHDQLTSGTAFAAVRYRVTA
ncbi:MAG: hypothetical protein ACRD1E_07620, partial [Terriglobales bacterium]